MIEQTRVFKRLPKDSGVTFSGFENIRLSGRETVREQLEDFLTYCKEANSTAFRVVLGEWGEGKTDAYKRYILPKSISENNYAFMVSASSLSNCYDIPAVRRLFETTSLSAVRFLTALFFCVKEEEKEQSIPDLMDFEKAEAYLDRVLEVLCTAKKHRIIVFIDEFEDLINLKDKLKLIISGIKATINGQYGKIDEKGKFSGCLHLMVAATPDAFYQLEVGEETSLIFGGLGRRIGIIDLPKVRKEEGINFLLGLLKYSYEDSLPKPLPFKTIGTFNAIFRITQGNLGVMVSLFTRLMNSAKENQHLRIINADSFLDFLKNQQFSVYGANTPCLETEPFVRMLQIIEDQKTRDIGRKCGALLKLLTGELKPFSILDLVSRTGWNERDIKRYINIINDDLKNRENIKHCILKVAPLKKTKSPEMVSEVLKEYLYMQKEKEWIKIGNYSESVEDFFDRITFFNFDGEELVSQIYLPCQNTSVESFFEGVDTETSVELANLFRRKLCTEDQSYLVSEDFLSQVYYTPIPKGWEFITDRDVKWKIWKELRKDFSDQYVRFMPIAFTNVLIQYGLLGIEDTQKLATNAMASRANIGDMGITLFFYAVNGDVKKIDIDEISLWLKKTLPPIHCCIILYTGDFTEEAYDKIENKGMGIEGKNILLPIKLHPTLARRLLGIYKAQNNYPNLIDKNLLTSSVQKIITQEINFESKIENWLSTQVEKGVVIKDLDIDSTSNLREFAGALKFYINFSEQRSSPERIFKQNREKLLEKFVKYRSKVGLIPDIELPKFKNISKDLMLNGFLQKEKNVYLIKQHPVERRIISVLSEKTRLSENELQNFFVFKSRRLFKDVFLPILEYKGLIRKEAKDYLLTDVKALKNDVDLDYQVIRRQLKADNRIWDYGYAFFIKQKGQRFITLREFIDYIDNLFKETEDHSFEKSKETALQKLSLIRSLTEHFSKNFLPLFRSALDRGKKITEDIDEDFSQFSSDLEDIVNGAQKWLKLGFELENIEEYRTIFELFDQINTIQKLNFEETKDLVNSLRKKEKQSFFFDKEEEKADYFNPKLFKMERLKQQFYELKNRNAFTIKDTQEIFEKLEDNLLKIETRGRSIAIEKEYQVSSKVLEVLQSYVGDILPKTESLSYSTISLQQIKNRTIENEEALNSVLSNLSKCFDQLEDITNNEEELINKFEKAEELAKHTKWIFDTKEYLRYYKELNSKIAEAVREYSKMGKDLAFEDSEKLLEDITKKSKKLKELYEQIDDAENEISKAWHNYAKQTGSFTQEIDEFLTFFRNKKQEISSEIIEVDLKTLKERIETIDLRKLSFKLSEIDELKETIRANFYRLIEKVLTEKEMSMLQLIMKETKNKDGSWLSDIELLQIAQETLQIEKEELKQILKKLIDAGYIQSGFSLVV